MHGGDRESEQRVDRLRAAVDEHQATAARMASTQSCGSRGWRAPGSESRLVSSSASGIDQRAQPALGDQALVDRAHPAAEDRVDGGAERDRLAVHRPARADDEVGVGDQALRVDRCARGRSATRSRASRRLALGARDQHGDRAGLGGEPVEDRGVERVALVVGGSLRRRADDGEHRARVDAELAEDRGIGLEVGEVVVLLQPRVAEQLALRGAGAAASPRRRSRRGRARGAPRGRRAGAAGRRTRSPASAPPGSAAASRPRRGRPSRGRARGRSAAAAPSARAPRCAGRGPGPCRRSPRRRGGRTTSCSSPSRSSSPTVCPYSRAVISTSCAGLAQALDDRPQDERMRRGSAVDPDPHAPKLTGRPAGLIGWGPNNDSRGGVADG